MQKPVHVDVCSGIGAFGIAAYNAGFETRAFCEIDAYCQRVLARHFPRAYLYHDLKSLDADAFRAAGIDRIHLFTGGIPCQPFSLAGEQRGTEDDRHLWPEAHRIICALRPDWVVIENVSGFIGMALDLVLSELEAAGYECGTLVLPACSVGAPHRRDRVWIVAHAQCAERGPLPQAGEYHANGHDSRRPEASSGFRLCGQDVADASMYPSDGIRPDGADRAHTANNGIHPPTRRSDLLGSYADVADPCGVSTAQAGAPISSLGSRWDARHYDGWGDGGRLPGTDRPTTQPRMGGMSDGLASWLDGLRWPAALGADQYEWEPRRTASSVKNRTPRLKACGNAIVWQVAYPILAAIYAQVAAE